MFYLRLIIRLAFHLWRQIPRHPLAMTYGRLETWRHTPSGLLGFVVFWRGKTTTRKCFPYRLVFPTRWVDEPLMFLTPRLSHRWLLLAPRSAFSFFWEEDLRIHMWQNTVFLRVATFLG